LERRLSAGSEIQSRMNRVRSRHPAGKSQVGQMHRKPEAVRIAAPLPDQGQILNCERVVSHDRPDFRWRVEQGGAGLG
jgi:hypothetical protein